MRQLSAIVALFALLCIASAHAEDAPSAETIDRWIKELGAEDFATRRAAETSLKNAGDAAQPALAKAADSPDAEIKLRAGRLVSVNKVEPTLKKMEAAAIAQNIEADMKIDIAMNGMNMVMKGHFIGLADNKHFNMDMTTNAMGQEIKMNMIADGETVWSEIQAPGMDKKLVQKYTLETMEKMSGAGAVTPTQAIQDVRKRYYFTSVKDEKLGDRDVYVLEGTVNKDFIDEHCKKMEELVGQQGAEMTRTQMEQMKRSKLYVDKDDLLVRKLETLSEDNTPLLTLELSNIKTGGKFDDAKFKYTVPEGATVQDMDEAFRMARQLGGGKGGDGAMPIPEPNDVDDGD